MVPRINIIAPIALSFVAMLLSLLIKWTMNATSFRRSNPARGHELFRIFFIGPDLSLLSLGLLVASQALRSILSGHNIETNFGDDFAVYFWTLVIGLLAVLFVCMFFWLRHDDDERALAIQRTNEWRRDRDGRDYPIEVWAVDWKLSFKRRPAILLLVIGNVLGVACVLSYGWFIYRGFVQQ